MYDRGYENKVSGAANTQAGAMLGDTRRAHEVPAEINSLEKNVHALRELVDQLDGRLAHVSRPAPPTPAPTGITGSVESRSSGMGAQLHDINQMTRSLQHRISMVLDLLEV